jgi:hypothetical protein
MLLGTIFLATVIGYGVACLIALFLPLSTWIKGLIAIVLAVVLTRSAEPWLRRAYVYHLLDDAINLWKYAQGLHPDLDARLEQFAQRIVAASRETSAQEILIVGHSSGSILAIDIVARALVHDPELGRHGPSLALLTIGACVPVVALASSAQGLRQAITRLATEPSLLWVEYQAPEDLLNAFGFDPIRDLQLDLGGRTRINPIIRSVRFDDVLFSTTHRRIRWNFLRIHFQFLMANERPGEYDYLMIACGPVSLADRIRDPAQAVTNVYGTGFQPSRDDARVVEAFDLTL